MRLNIVTENFIKVNQDLESLFGEKWHITYGGMVAENIHDFTLSPKDYEVNECTQVMSVENLLELGIEPHNIRIYG